jgi:hypothetical protein
LRFTASRKSEIDSCVTEWSCTRHGSPTELALS